MLPRLASDDATPYNLRQFYGAISMAFGTIPVVFGAMDESFVVQGPACMAF